MKNFLFVTALTPEAYLTPLRKKLQSMFLKALKNQTHNNWSALLIGEYEKVDGNIKYVKTDCIGKIEKHQFVYTYLKNLSPAPDYLIRLDDDDLISPVILDQLKKDKSNFDCYADEFHAYYDVVSDKICQVKNAWLPNTVIHRFEHALTCTGSENKPLFEHDHDTWMEYYKDKKIGWAEKSTPVYLRVLSPTTQTSGMHSLLLNEFTNDILEKYSNRIEKIGKWNRIELSPFKEYMPELRSIWRSVSVKGYQVCCRCILDTNDDTNMRFDHRGICNYCQYYDELASTNLYFGEVRERKLLELVNKVKQNGIGKKYDCIVGVSGGVDSTYLALFVKQLGLRPLAVHLDYGWNSDLAVKNIKNILHNLEIDLYTYVVDWEEIKDLQLAFFKASVIDIELINDFAALAVLHNTAHQKGIKYVFNGGNIVTEGGRLPSGWTWSKFDQLNIQSIHEKYGLLNLKTYPKLSFWKRLYYTFFYKLHYISLLNYTDYNKEMIKEIIIQKLDWKDYGGKHFESIFTRFYQGYILPKKFKVNKRKFHLSVLICSGQMTREQALEQMKIDDYPPDRQNEDKEYVLKKLELTNEEFEHYMNLPVKQHSDYPTYLNSHYKYHIQFMELIKPLTKLYRYFQ